MAKRETGLAAGSGSEEIEALKREVREEEAELASTIGALKKRMSYRALRERAVEKSRQIAIEKPKAMARSAATGAYGGIERGMRLARQQPLIPIILGIGAILPVLIPRLLRTKKQH